MKSNDVIAEAAKRLLIDYDYDDKIIGSGVITSMTASANPVGVSYNSRTIQSISGTEIELTIRIINPSDKTINKLHNGFAGNVLIVEDI